MLLVAFSLGLAIVLMAIGVLVLYAKNLLPKGGSSERDPAFRCAAPPAWFADPATQPLECIPGTIDGRPSRVRSAAEPRIPQHPHWVRSAQGGKKGTPGNSATLYGTSGITRRPPEVGFVLPI